MSEEYEAFLLPIPTSPARDRENLADMTRAIDPTQYRDAAGMLVPEGMNAEPDILLDILNRRHGTWSADQVEFEGGAAHQYRPSGIISRVKNDTLVGLWVPLSTTDETLSLWRADVDHALASRGVLTFYRPILCDAVVAHRWELPRSELVLSPMPATAPRGWSWCTEQPAVLQMRYESCNDRVTNASRASRCAQRVLLLLNATTPLGCHESVFGRQGWGWDRSGDVGSRWVEHTYFATEMLDGEAVRHAREVAPMGVFIDDHEYYLARRVTADNAIVLPACLDETLAATRSLPAHKQRLLLRAARWIKAGDRAALDSQSLQFLAIAIGLETLAADRGPAGKSRTAFRALLSDLLPRGWHVDAAADEMYKLRSGLAHGGKTLPWDWIDRPMNSEERDLSVLFHMIWLCRLVLVNWIRTEAGLSPVTVAQECQP